MPAVVKKPKAGGGAPKSKAAPPPARVVTEVDVLIARLKKIREGQHGGIDVRQAIEDGRD
jgi:hypothetical protein